MAKVGKLARIKVDDPPPLVVGRISKLSDEPQGAGQAFVAMQVQREAEVRREAVEDFKRRLMAEEALVAFERVFWQADDRNGLTYIERALAAGFEAAEKGGG